jgi:hypothetical protein
MKYIITEDQLNKVKEKILKLPFSAFDNDWNLLQEFLKRKGNPPYILIGDLNLGTRKDIISLGSLIEINGSLNLFSSSIESIGSLISVDDYLDLSWTNIKDLGNLTHVGGSLLLYKTEILDLGNLTYVGDDLSLLATPVSRIYSEEQIRDVVDVGGVVFI